MYRILILLCNSFFFFNLFGYSFLVALGLCFAWAFSSCGAWASHWGGFSRCREQALQRRLNSCGSWDSVVPRPVRYSQSRDRTCVPYTGRQILSHYTTEKVLYFVILILLLLKKDRNRRMWERVYQGERIQKLSLKKLRVNLGILYSFYNNWFAKFTLQPFFPRINF